MLEYIIGITDNGPAGPIMGYFLNTNLALGHWILQHTHTASRLKRIINNEYFILIIMVKNEYKIARRVTTDKVISKV